MATSTAAPAAAQARMPAASPFRVGTLSYVTTDGYTNTTALTTATQTLPVYSPSASGFLRGLWLTSSAVGVNSSTSVVFQGDGPFCAYSTVQFNDTQGRPIILVDGYRLMLINKFGGYNKLGDPRASAMYSTTTSTVAGAGSWNFTLYIPLEIVGRDAIGSLQNKNEASPFQLLLTLNNLAGVFTSSHAPATSCTVTTTIIEDSWLDPKPADAAGNPLSPNPPALGTTQYWLQTSYASLNGATQSQLTGGLGYPIRNILFLNYDASNATRATGDTDFPTSVQLIYKGQTIKNIPQTFWKDQMCRDYGLTASATSSSVIAPTYDSANGLENGVYVIPFNKDFDNAPGAELRNGYLVTQQGDQFQFVGTFSGSSNLYELVNYIAPGDGNPASLRAQR